MNFEDTVEYKIGLLADRDLLALSNTLMSPKYKLARLLIKEASFKLNEALWNIFESFQETMEINAKNKSTHASKASKIQGIQR